MTDISPTLIIRKPTDTEFHDIHALVHELAIFEKSPESHTVKAEQYLQDYRNGWFEVEVAIYNGEIAGMIFFYQSYSTWRGKMLYLEDFIVKNELRNMGIGKQLFKRFIQIAKERNCALAKWEVLDWNNDAIRFYEREGAEIERHWWDGKIIFDQ